MEGCSMLQLYTEEKVPEQTKGNCTQDKEEKRNTWLDVETG